MQNVCIVRANILSCDDSTFFGYCAHMQHIQFSIFIDVMYPYFSILGRKCIGNSCTYSTKLCTNMLGVDVQKTECAYE